MRIRRNQSHIALMQLGEWLKTQPDGALRRLCERSGVAYRTLIDLKMRRRAARLDTAEAVSAATGGAVGVHELMAPTLPYLQDRARRRRERIEAERARRAKQQDKASA